MNNLYFVVRKKEDPPELRELIIKAFSGSGDAFEFEGGSLARPNVSGGFHFSSEDNTYVFEGRSLTISTALQGRNDSTGPKYLLTISCDEKTTNKLAEALFDAEIRLREIANKFYYFIPLQLDSSLHYGKKMYSFFADIELKLRQIIISISVCEHGGYWLNYMPDILEKSCNTRHKRENTYLEAPEDGIQQLDFNDLITFLFVELPPKDISKKIQESNFSKELANKSASEIEAILQDYRPISFWERSLSTISKDSERINKGILSSVKSNRNKFAHYKVISPSDYNKFMKEKRILLSEINKIIDALNKGLWRPEFNTILAELTKSLDRISRNITANLPTAMLTISEIFKANQDKFSGITANLSAALQPINEFNKANQDKI